MNVTLARMTFGRAEMKWVKALFLSAFPPEERPPFFIMRMRARHYTDWWLIQSGGKNAGFFYVIRDERLAYLFFSHKILRWFSPHGTMPYCAQTILQYRYSRTFLYFCQHQVQQEVLNWYATVTAI